MPKVLVVGFDGATWDIISSLIAKGSLPTFQKIMETSCWGYLESTIPPMTIPAWICMFSGLQPETLCMFDFNRVTIKDKVAESRLFNTSDYKGKLVWDLLSRKGFKSLVLNIPGTYPPYPIEGHLIGLDMTPMESMTYPEGIEKILTEEHDLNKLRELQKTLGRGKKSALQMVEHEEQKILEILTSFSRKFPYDVIFVRFGIPDHVSHHTIDDADMERCHILMDSILKTVCESVDYDYLMIVSDHGIKKTYKTFCINKYFQEIGLLKRTFLGHAFEFILRTVNIRRAEAKKEEFFVNEKLNDIFEAAVFAYSAVPTNFSPLYVTDPSVKDTVVKILEECGLIQSIYITSCTEVGPWAVVESRYPISTVDFRKRIFEEERWVHDMRGIFLVSGKDIRKGNVSCHICDIAPTILHILGLPVPTSMDGEVVTDMFEETSKMRKKPEYVDVTYYMEEDEKERIKRSVEKLKLKRSSHAM